LRGRRKEEEPEDAKLTSHPIGLPVEDGIVVDRVVSDSERSCDLGRRQGGGKRELRAEGKGNATGRKRGEREEERTIS